MKIAITGAAGFIGANLCRFFLEKGSEVNAVVRNTLGITDHWRYIEHDNITYDSCDFNDPLDIFELFNNFKPEVIINCASYGGYSNQSSKEDIYNTNQNYVCNMHECLVEEKFKIKAFIQLGTSSEYGLNSAGPDERSHTIPNSHYAVSKLAATSLCQYYGKMHKVPVTILRLGSVYGPYEDPGRFIMKACLTAHKEKKLIPLASTNIARDFIHIDDVCRAIDNSLEFVSSGEIYNVSRGYPQYLVDVLDDVSNAYGMPCTEMNRLKQDADLIKPWDHFKPWCMNTDKIQEKFGWEPKIDMINGIHMVKEWIENNPEIVTQMRSVYG